MLYIFVKKQLKESSRSPTDLIQTIQNQSKQVKVYRNRSTLKIYGFLMFLHNFWWGRGDDVAEKIAFLH